MASLLLASADANLRVQLRRMLGTSARLGRENLMEAGSVGEVAAALAAGTLDAAILDEALFAGATPPTTTRRTPILLLSAAATEPVTREEGRTVLRHPSALGRLVEEVERLLPPPPPAKDPAAEIEDAFRALQRDYLQSLPERIAALRVSLKEARTGVATHRENARRIFHQIRGTGASFGLPDLTDAAARGETLLVEAATRPTDELWAAADQAANAMETIALTGVPGPA
jgi:HPt (histidine-containing phosphotransfer) domain-containing protein